VPGLNAAYLLGMKHSKATFGIYRSKEEVNAAVSLLRDLGFGLSRASVLYPERAGSQDFPNVQKSELAKFARIGSVLGAGLLMIFAILAVSGAVSFLHTGDMQVTDRVFTVIASVFLGGVIGAACGALVGMGTPDQAGHRYGQYVDAGGILLSVQSESADEQKRIEAVLEKSGAQDITSLDEEKTWFDVMEETKALTRVNLSPSSGQNSRPFSMFEDSPVN
jgi:hypothetical protein